eukprot:1406878-Amphidinium_carterae.1
MPSHHGRSLCRIGSTTIEQSAWITDRQGAEPVHAHRDLPIWQCDWQLSEVHGVPQTLEVERFNSGMAGSTTETGESQQQFSRGRVRPSGMDS